MVIASNIRTNPAASSQQTVCFGQGGVGEVRRRVRVRRRWSNICTNPAAGEQWNSGRGLPLRGVYPTPSHIGAPGPPETTCRQGQVTRGGSSSMGKSAGTTACCQRGLVFYGQVTEEKGQRRIKKMYVEATASKQKPDCLGMRKDTRYT